ncbi:potassium transporter 19-like [Cucumis melo var. makuwa]|uniref:Potassium transporter 19-like n=1 Tax=Cucumis melo var. makuwa TaxID=1194695 RepID=A0A5D3CNC6_CUCMM|nr:potassium transporter 19-like [Cucumis melo var. makuwa]
MKLRDLGLEYETIHACKYDCVLYWKEFADLQYCPTGGETRYKEGSTNMRWHRNKRVETDDVLRHPTDAKGGRTLILNILILLMIHEMCVWAWLQMGLTHLVSQPLSRDEICDQVLGRRLGYSKGLGWEPKPKARKITCASSSTTSCSSSTQEEIELQSKLNEALERIELQDRNHATLASQVE